MTETSPARSTHDDETVAREQHLRAGAVTGPASAAAQLARGFAMGAADVVPGVSGGTVALVLGIYEHLIATVRRGALALGAALKLDLSTAVERLRRVDWTFLLPLVAGIGLAVVSLAGPLSHLLEEEPVVMSAVFAGLVLGSTVVAWTEVERFDAPRLAVGAVVAVVTFFALGVRGSALADASLPVYFLSGAVAVCAMILPGVSGSFLLVMLGMYELVIEAVDARDVVTLLVFTVGAATGLGLFSTGLNWLLSNHRDTVLAGLIGLMAGSLRVLWPWPAGEDGIGDTRLGTPEGGDVLAVAVAAVVSFAVVLVVAWWAHRATVPPAEPQPPRAE